MTPGALFASPAKIAMALAECALWRAASMVPGRFKPPLKTGFVLF